MICSCKHKYCKKCAAISAPKRTSDFWCCHKCYDLVCYDPATRRQLLAHKHDSAERYKRNHFVEAYGALPAKWERAHLA